MNSINQKIQNHYHKDGLFEDILNRLSQMNIDLNFVQRADIASVDEFHVRGAAVSKELAKSVDLIGKSVLDIGCGVGGPCRMLADEFNCTAIGIDLSSEFIRTATELSKLVNLEDKTSFIQADATNLPFDDETFDIVWTQHVQMNISEKKQFYSEIKRVLKKGGYFLYYDIFKTSNNPINYPMPWASDESLSFLFNSTEMNEILDKLDFTNYQTVDQTKAGLKFIEELIKKLQTNGPPKLGLNVLMKESTPIKIKNAYTHLKMGDLKLESGVFKK
ncbi:MAG: SAM-dependent methyltransferase [Crocinitomicaceae bacterium]|nr:SAM-dependent methyltransferase [Crocinitomicaceae bacterium]|tara:strand:- start:1178 stop:2002 length:825 start_codon:yes stop_codon:yes gene_type:complete